VTRCRGEVPPFLLTTETDSLADRVRGSLLLFGRVAQRRLHLTVNQAHHTEVRVLPRPLFASMVELADTPDLGSGAREGLGVQVPLLV